MLIIPSLVASTIYYYTPILQDIYAPIYAKWQGLEYLTELPVAPSSIKKDSNCISSFQNQ